MRIRAIEPPDHESCRHLYTELVQHHRDIYDQQGIGGTDPGAGFDEYLARSDRVETWVAVDGDTIVGMCGLLWQDGDAEIEPVVVTENRRGAGIARRLIETAIQESRRRGATDVNIRPVARNVSAIRAFHELGFRTVGHVQLFMRLSDSEVEWADLDLHDRRFGH
ncbi:MAG: GNAT family N-acetyltransferase [Ilumatobacteraceae bacterium]